MQAAILPLLSPSSPISRSMQPVWKSFTGFIIIIVIVIIATITNPTTIISSNIVTILINTVLPRRTLQSSDGWMVGSELHGKWKWYWFYGGESGQLDESESERLDRRIWVQAIKWYPWPWHATQPFKRLLVKGYKLTVILSSVCKEFLLTSSWIWWHCKYKVGGIDDVTKKKLLTKVTNTCSTWPFSTVSDSSAPNPPVKIIAKLDKC